MLCGFVTVLSGTAVLHSTRDPEPPPSGTSLEAHALHIAKHAYELIVSIWIAMDEESIFSFVYCNGYSMNDLVSLPVLVIQNQIFKGHLISLTDLYTSLSPQISWHVHANGEIWKQKDNDELQFLGLIRPDYFK